MKVEGQGHKLTLFENAWSVILCHLSSDLSEIWLVDSPRQVSDLILNFLRRRLKVKVIRRQLGKICCIVFSLLFYNDSP